MLLLCLVRGIPPDQRSKDCADSAASELVP